MDFGGNGRNVVVLYSTEFRGSILAAFFSVVSLFALTLLPELAHAESKRSRAQNQSALPAVNQLSTTQAQTAQTDAALQQKDINQTFQFAYRLSSQFSSFANEREQMQSMGLKAELEAKRRLLPRLLFVARAGANYESGYAQSRFGEFSGNNALVLDETYLSLRILDMTSTRLTLAAGALNQRELETSMLVSDQAFPGARETLTLGSKEFFFKIWAQQTVPTSKSLSTRAVDAEVTPSFLTETAEIGVEPLDGLRGRIFATHYAFHNLPSAVAVDSIVYGNTTDETGPLTEKFKYRFDGFLAGGSAEIDLGRSFSMGVEGYTIQNTAAPESYRNGQRIDTFMRIGLPGDIDITPSAGVFFAESDVSPAFYNDSRIGHNNRQGWLASFETFFKKERFKLRADYTDSDVINPSKDQSRQQIIRFRFETLYDLL